MLRKIRIIIALIFFVPITLLFLDFGGTLQPWFGWLAKIQFLPAALALNVGIFLFLIVLTLVFGRIYCSVICPLGIFQDVLARIVRRRKKKHYSYTPAISWMRYGVLALFILCMIAGFIPIVTLFDPYGSFGRMANNLLLPFWQWGNNLLAFFAADAGSYAFSHVDVWIRSLPVFTIAVVTFMVLVVLVMQNGRTYCNAVCPVGTVLGFLSRYSFFRIAIDSEKCNKCSVCARNCKSGCIDFKQSDVDYSRCVACMDCIGKCKMGAIRYQPVYINKKQEKLQTEKVTVHEPGNKTRRSFLTVLSVFAVSSLLKAQDKKVDGGLAAIEGKKIPARNIPILPPGSLSETNMKQHCTGCQLCVSVCPNNVLRPSNNLLTFMQPEMSFERGYCRPECTRCSEVCPTGAISLITKAQKSSLQIGRAKWIKQNCVVIKDNVDCNNCERHCPTNAIQMVLSDPSVKGSRKIPAVNSERCIGCGACETLCPARPFSALYVEGQEIQRFI